MSLKSLFAPKDMTTGKPMKRIAQFALPMIIGNIAQQLYSTVDSIVVGKYVGDNALAAVGSSGPIYNLLLVLFIGISTGAGITVSQYFGAKKREELSYAIGNCISLIAIASGIIMLVGPLVSTPLLRLLGTPESIIEWCSNYLRILLLGVAGCGFYNILSGVLRGLGDSMSALLYLLVATVINIGLDVYFVAGLGMGVPGVALATVIAQSVSAVLCVLKLMKLKEVFDLKPHYIKINPTFASQIIRLGLPSGLTQAIMSMAMIVVQSLTNSFGEMFIAANVIIMRVDGFAMMPNFSFGNAMTTFAGQNIGARKLDRVKQGAKEGTILGLSVSTVITLILVLFGDKLMMLFTETPELLALSFRNLRILAVGYIAMAVTQCLSGTMRGAGDTMSPMWISMITTFVVRIPIAYGLAWLTGRSECIQISLVCSWIIGSIITTLVYRKGAWKNKALD